MRLMQQNVNNLTQLHIKMENVVFNYDTLMDELQNMTVS